MVVKNLLPIHINIETKYNVLQNSSVTGKIYLYNIDYKCCSRTQQ